MAFRGNEELRMGYYAHAESIYSVSGPSISGKATVPPECAAPVARSTQEAEATSGICRPVNSSRPKTYPVSDPRL